MNVAVCEKHGFERGIDDVGVFWAELDAVVILLGNYSQE